MCIRNMGAIVIGCSSILINIMLYILSILYSGIDVNQTPAGYMINTNKDID